MSHHLMIVEVVSSWLTWVTAGTGVNTNFVVTWHLAEIRQIMVVNWMGCVDEVGKYVPLLSLEKSDKNRSLFSINTFVIIWTKRKIIFCFTSFRSIGVWFRLRKPDLSFQIHLSLLKLKEKLQLNILVLLERWFRSLCFSSGAHSRQVPPDYDILNVT